MGISWASLVSNNSYKTFGVVDNNNNPFIKVEVDSKSVEVLLVKPVMPMSFGSYRILRKLDIEIENV